MDDAPLTFTSLALIVLLIAMIVMFVCHFLRPRATSWARSNKEEKIGLSKNKLFHANGYMIHSGSEFLLSTSGSFKRFDTIDKDDYKESGGAPAPQQATTPLWNLPQTDGGIPPQPLRPAPGRTPGSAASHGKSVTFSFSQLDETLHATHDSQQHVNGGNVGGGALNTAAAAIGETERSANGGGGGVAATLVSCMRSAVSATPLPQPIEAPPPPRLSSCSSTSLCGTAIPRPVAKRQVSLQNGTGLGCGYGQAEGVALGNGRAQANANGLRHGKALTRRNSSTNPFLCESAESLNDAAPSSALASSNNSSNNNNNSNQSSGQLQREVLGTTRANIEVRPTTTTNGNPFHEDATQAAAPSNPLAVPLTEGEERGGGLRNTLTNGHHQPIRTFSFKMAARAALSARGARNRSFSETEASDSDMRTYSSRIASSAAGLQKFANSTTNPFAGLTQRVKGPHMLQKTISEDFLFRKLGVNAADSVANGVGCGGGGGSAGNTTWTFGRSFMRQESSLSLGRRNSSQCSLDGSMDGINLERAISCDSVNSESSVFLSDLDQPYTQITGYLCVGLNYDKNTITEDGMELSVSVLEAKGLLCPFSVVSLDTFVRIYLVPDQAGAMQTKVFVDSSTPCYNESFNFWLTRQHGRRHSLWFHLYHNGAAHTLIGEAEMEISDMPRSVTTWIPLSDSRKCNAKWGELMFSLSYLPTAERLTIVVVKARNLKLDAAQSPQTSPQEIHNVFVKVYVMNNEKKVLKKRTSLKRKDRCPIFNESMIFSLPPQSLTTVQLRLTVFGVIDGSTIQPLGHVIAGSCATGKGLRHWHQMLSSLRKPVAMWHVLRRATNQPVFTGGAEAVVAAMQSTALRSKRNSII